MSKRKPKMERCGICGAKPRVREAVVAVWSETRIRPVGYRCNNGCIETFNDPDGSKWNQLMRWAKAGRAMLMKARSR